MTHGTPGGRILTESDGRGITTVRIDNPAHRNALNDGLINQLIDAFRACAKDDTCRVVVLRGTNGIFCAGRELRDLVKLQSAPIETVEATYHYLRQLNEAVYYCPKPTVAVVEKYAFGAGATVLSWVDIAIGETDAFVAYPEVHHGITPSPAVMALIRGVSRKNVMDLLMTGRRVEMPEAVQMGLVNRAVDRSALDAELARITAALVRGSPDAQRRTKEFIWQCEDAGLRSGMETAVQSISVGLLSPQARDGIGAFLERRLPAWMPR